MPVGKVSDGGTNGPPCRPAIPVKKLLFVTQGLEVFVFANAVIKLL